MTTDLPITEITLRRGETGLGFNIRGGTDIPHFADDSGIFVTRLKETGAAFKDQRLKEGDKILEVNGHDIQAVTHNEAVQIFISAGEQVTLKVQAGAEAHILNALEAKRRSSVSGAMVALVVLLGAAAAAGVGFYFLRAKASH